MSTDRFDHCPICGYVFGPNDKRNPWHSVYICNACQRVAVSGPLVEDTFSTDEAGAQHYAKEFAFPEDCHAD